MIDGRVSDTQINAQSIAGDTEAIEGEFIDLSLLVEGQSASIISGTEMAFRSGITAIVGARRPAFRTIRIIGQIHVEDHLINLEINIGETQQ